MFKTNLDYLRSELDRSHDEFITEHFRKYDEPDMPPAWKTLEVASFGTLSKLYRNMNDNAVKKQVARSFNIPQHKCLQSWLASLTIVRNTFTSDFKALLAKYPNVDSAAMGCPQGWQDNPLWRGGALTLRLHPLIQKVAESLRLHGKAASAMPSCPMS